MKSDDIMEEEIELMKGGKRLDGRGPSDLRPMGITANVIKNANGSAYMEWGNNRIIAAVYGPTEALPKHTANPDKAVVKCRYMMAPFSSISEHGRPGMNRRAVEISKVTREVFEHAILVDKFPGCEINIYIEILQSDGGTRAAGITCAAVALASSGIPMRDMPYSVSAGNINETVVIDLNMIEDMASDADMPVAILPRNNEVVLLQMDGSFTKEQFDSAMELIRKSGEYISNLQKKALKEPYEKIIDRYA